MKRIALRTLITLLSTPVAFYVGFVVSAIAQKPYELRMAKEYPHDGQIGLGVFVTSLYGGCACAVVVLAFGTYWTIRAIRRSRSLLKG